MEISSFAAWVPLLALGFVQYRRSKANLYSAPTLLFWVGAYFLLSACADAIMFTLAKLDLYNHSIAQAYGPLSFFFGLLIFRSLFSAISDRWFVGLAAAMVLVKVSEFLWFYPAMWPSSVFRGLVFSTLSLLYLWSVPLWSVPQRPYPILRELSFWVVSAFLLYYFSNLLLFAARDLIWPDRELLYLWGLHAVFNITKALLVTLGLLLIPYTLRAS